MKFQHWSAQRGREGATWGWRASFWRVQFSLLVHRHEYPLSSDRWVFQPGFVYDRKRFGPRGEK